MKRIIIAGLCVASTIASADCFVHSDIKLVRQSIQAGPTDMQRLVTPTKNGVECVTNYRVYIKGSWRTAEGKATAKTESEACLNATILGNGYVLSEVTPDQVTADMKMVCSDIPEIRIHKVQIGDVVWESETDVHILKEEQTYFNFKGSICRFFTEQSARDQNMITNQGVICKMNSTLDSKWQVIDKF